MLKKTNDGSWSTFRSLTLLRQCSITIAINMNFKTTLTKRINTQQVNALDTYIFATNLVLLLLTRKMSLCAGYSP